jgi:hypothetical protein
MTCRVCRLLRKFGATILLTSAFLMVGNAQSVFNINLDSVRRSVVFLHVVDSAGQLQEAGTAFLIGVPLKSNPNQTYEILVTARHIVDPAWAGCKPSNGTLVAVFNKNL